jgi:hypothetical protein
VCTILVVFALIPMLHAQKAVIPPEVEDEQVLVINKESYHAMLMPYKGRGGSRGEPCRFDLGSELELSMEIPLGSPTGGAPGRFL